MDVRVLPYYFVPQSDDPIQQSDVKAEGTADGPYTVYYRPYSVYAGPSGVDPFIAKYQEEYKDYVKKTYRRVDTATAAYMNLIIEQEGFDKKDPDVIQKVAAYIQSSATYNLAYDQNLDREPNVALAFLGAYKEGVCRHYATAATLLYRTLGFPARYAVGFMTDVRGGQTTAVKGMDAHAWVEVYVEDFGWQCVEVTGSLAGTDPGGTPGTGTGTGTQPGGDPGTETLSEPADTEAPTDPVTEAPTETPTEAPTDAPANNETSAPAATDAETDNAGGGCTSLVGAGSLILLLAAALAALRTQENTYDLLLSGAADGLKLMLSLIPALILLLTAVTMLRASGAIEAISQFLAPVFSFFGIPPETAILILVRPISGSAALAVGADLMANYGVDSLVGRTAAVMLGSTETTFYTVSVYFGAAGIKKTRYTIPAALIADLTGFLVASLTVRLFFR